MQVLTMNKAGFLRKGFNFQDSYGLLLCSEWLMAPGKYKVLHFEFKPDDAGKNFTLDDIALIDDLDKKRLYQAKYKDDPSYVWSFEDLTQTGLTKKGKVKPSLLQKWADSVKNTEDLAYAALVSNAQADTQIKECMKGTLVEPSLIKEKHAGLYVQLCSHLGGESELNAFFQAFHFELGHNNIEQTTRKNFQSVGVRKAGRNQLELMIKNEASKTFTVDLTLENIRNACEFDKPRPLVEDILLPDDFQIFDATVHKKLVKELRSVAGGVRVIYGKPGAGKTTYLSNLATELSGDRDVIKHHYYLGPDDADGVQRLDADRAVEAIKEQFLKLPDEVLGEVGNKNPGEVQLKDYVNQSAKYYAEHNKSLVLIIDGLDHVIRQKDNDQLVSSLDAIAYPQKGLWILLGTQESALKLIPNSLTDATDKKDWIEVKGFSKATLKKIVKQNIAGLLLPVQKEAFDELVDKIFSLTQGNPLHLRYTLQQLQNVSPDKIVLSYDCGDLIPYSGSIESYYATLWGRLSVGSKNLLSLIAGIDFYLKQEWLVDIANSDATLFPPATLHTDESSVQHLILRNKQEYLSIYHNSFLEFVVKTEEFKSVASPIRRSVLQWLQSSDNDALKWSETARLKYYLGDEGDITAIDHDWLIDAIRTPRNPKSITKQFNLALKASFETGDYAQAFRFHALRNYHENAIDYNDEQAQEVWIEAFRAHGSELTADAVESFDLAALSTNQLVEIARWAHEVGETEIVEAVFERFNDLHPISTRPKSDGQGMPSVASNLLRCLVYMPFNEIDRASRYIKQFRNHEWAEDLFAVYAASLVEAKRSWMLNELMGEDLTQGEKVAIINTCTNLWLEHNDDQDIKGLIEAHDNHISGLQEKLIYLTQGGNAAPAPSIPKREEQPPQVPEHDFSGRGSRQAFLVGVFMKAAIHGYLQTPEGKSYSLEGSDWLSGAMVALFKWGYEYGDSLKNGKTYDLSVAAGLLGSVERLTWQGNSDTVYEFWVAFNNALDEICSLVLRTNYVLKEAPLIDDAEYLRIVSSVHFRPHKLLEVILLCELPVLTTSAHKKLNDDINSKLDAELETFPERTSDYLRLTRLARQHRSDQDMERMLELSARNLMGYGYHKDMFLSSIMDCLEVVIQAGAQRHLVTEWIKRVSPIIENVTDFTDGDETRHFPSEITDFLVLADRSLANSYYLSKIEKEEYWTAQSVFGILVKTMPFADPIENALVETATDETSQEVLLGLAKSNKKAAVILEDQKDYFGDVDPEKDSASSTPWKPEKVDYSGLKPSDFMPEKIPDGGDVWKREQYLSGWLSHWSGIEPKAAYEAFKKHYGDSMLKQRGEVLDALYPLAYKYDDRQFAFDLLCQANDKNHGWDRFWTDKGKAVARWEFLKKHYPKRYKEFLSKTLAADDGFYFVMPIPRVVEFFIYFDDLKEAEAITEQAIAFAESLMANINLPSSEWLNRGVTNTEVLLERLRHPSPITRERTATTLVKLLSQAEPNDLLKELVKWIRKQSLESYSLLGIIVLERASREQRLQKYKSVLPSLIKSIPARSVVTYQLLSKLNGREGLGLEIELDVPIMPQPPTGYRTSTFFAKYISSFLSPVYKERALQIETRSLRPFVRYWSYQASQLMESIGIEEALNDVHYFAGSNYQSKRVACAFRLSEVYRTSYLRTLHFFYEQGLMPEEFYLEYSFATLPIDFSYWPIKPNRIPKWWPGYTGPTEDVHKSKDKIVTEFLKQPEGEVLLFATGAIKPEHWKQGSEDFSIELYAFGYKLTGARRNTDEVIAKEVIKSSPILVQLPGGGHEEEVLNDMLVPLDLSEEKIYEEFVIHPVVGRLHPLSIAIWQWFRASHQMLVPLPKLLKDTKMEMTDNGFVHTLDKAKVGSYEEWTQGVRETLKDDAVPPFGGYYSIAKEYVDNYLKSNGLRLGYAYRIHVRVGDDFKSEMKTYYGLLNVSGIIL